MRIASFQSKWNWNSTLWIHNALMHIGRIDDIGMCIAHICVASIGAHWVVGVVSLKLCWNDVLTFVYWNWSTHGSSEKSGIRIEGKSSIFTSKSKVRMFVILKNWTRVKNKQAFEFRMKNFSADLWSCDQHCLYFFLFST